MKPWKFAERYTCTARLGQGYYGDAYRALDANLEREVALKLFQPGTPRSEAFEEARRLLELRGDHILPVLDADVYQDIPYMVTEIAEGGTAEDRMRPLGVPPNEAVRWVSQLLLGLDICHSRRLVHRDIRPSNVFLQSPDHARLGDFGVAERLDANDRVLAHGYPGIRSPEMYTDGEGSILSDIYSSGVTLYSLLAGEYAFRGTPAEIESAITNGTYTPLRDVSPHASRGLSRIVGRAMALNPKDRFQSAREMREALARLGSTGRWTRVTSHVGHLHCYRRRIVPRGSDLQLCVIQESGGLRVEVRRTRGRRTRLRDHCRLVHEGRLFVELRRTFDTLP